ncbi:MAG: hypothetical protein ACTSUF_03705 [Candidatus Heimdallarchaeaceae archaeon]
MTGSITVTAPNSAPAGKEVYIGIRLTTDVVTGETFKIKMIDLKTGDEGWSQEYSVGWTGYDLTTHFTMPNEEVHFRYELYKTPEMRLDDSQEFLITLGVDIIQMLVEMIPGMVVTGVGAVMTGILPGKAKIAGVVPLGIGLWLMLSPWLPTQPPTPCSSHTTQAECEAAGCYWWSDNTCHSTPEGAINAQIKEIVVNGG